VGRIYEKQEVERKEEIEEGERGGTEKYGRERGGRVRDRLEVERDRR